MKCIDCGYDIDYLEDFPGPRCLDCHAASPDVQRQIREMTAEQLAAMWGGKR